MSFIVFQLPGGFDWNSFKHGEEQAVDNVAADSDDDDASKVEESAQVRKFSV